MNLRFKLILFNYFDLFFQCIDLSNCFQLPRSSQFFLQYTMVAIAKVIIIYHHIIHTPLSLFLPIVNTIGFYLYQTKHMDRRDFRST